MKRICYRCKRNKPESKFYRNRTKAIGGKKYFSAYCRTCEAERTSAYIRSLRPKFVAYKGGKCQKCGYRKCIWALEFHHRDRTQKLFELRTARGFSDRIKRELDKCDLLCANCHREVEFQNFQNGAG